MALGLKRLARGVVWIILIRMESPQVADSDGSLDKVDDSHSESPHKERKFESRVFCSRSLMVA